MTGGKQGKLKAQTETLWNRPATCDLLHRERADDSRMGALPDGHIPVKETDHIQGASEA